MKKQLRRKVKIEVSDEDKKCIRPEFHNKGIYNYCPYCAKKLKETIHDRNNKK